MVRRLLLLLILLAVGSLLNAAVAFGTFAFVPPAAADEQDLRLADWPQAAPNGWPTPSSGHESRYRSVTFVVVESAQAVLEPDTGRERPACEMSLCRIGWPVRSLGMHGLIDRRGDPTPAGLLPLHTEAHGKLFLPISVQSWLGVPWLPARPLVAGFALDTLLYALVTGVLVVAAVQLRRKNRTLRGLCWRCAYPIGVSPVCTECGSPVSATAAPAPATAPA